MRLFVLSKTCQSHAHCSWCRLKEGGRQWRESIASAYTVPENNVDWECPEHIPWHDNVPTNTRQLVEVPRKTVSIPAKAHNTCASCQRKKQQ